MKINLPTTAQRVKSYPDKKKELSRKVRLRKKEGRKAPVINLLLLCPRFTLHLLWDNRWNSFMHFSLIVSMMLHFLSRGWYTNYLKIKHINTLGLYSRSFSLLPSVSENNKELIVNLFFVVMDYERKARKWSLGAQD